MRYVSLYSGAGGVDCGFEALSGVECVGAADHNAAAQRIYERNFPSHPFWNLDLADELPAALAEAWRGVDVVIGGPPCQDFSSARRTARRERAELSVAFVRHAIRLAPRFVVFENVQRARASAEFAAVCAVLREESYAYRHAVVDVTRLGVPQTRRRLVLFASRDEAALELAWTSFLGRFDAVPCTMRACFAAAGLSCADHVFFPACNQRARKSVYSVDGPAPTIRSIVRPLRARYTFNASDSTHDRSLVLPALTVAHHAAIQGFPQTFDWVGTRTDCARCVGNAVPVALATAIAASLYEVVHPTQASQLIT